MMNTKVTRILICGGRDYNDWAAFRNNMEEIANERFERSPEDEYGNFLYKVTIIAGGADGVDEMAATWAIINWTRYEEYKADWKKYGRSAGPIRNQQMLDEGKPELVISFPGNVGTADMVKKSKKAGIEVVDLRNI